LDPRITRLADLLVNYSTAAKPGENLLVETIGSAPLPLVEEIVRIATEGGVNVQYNIHDHTVLRAFLHAANEDQIAALTDAALHQMKATDCYIGVRGTSNASELADVPEETMRWYSKHYFEAVHLKERVANTRWVVLRYPNDAMAQLARKPVRAFEDFYYDVCTMDYARMSEAMDALVDLMSKTDKVHVIGQNTDITLSIKGLGPIKCDGKVNIPDGEVYTAPVKDSINGRICFNAGSLFQSRAFGPITLDFEDGKCVKVDAGGDTEAVEGILDRDDGARFVGEFALGVNPFITSPMLDTLFDEKIGGSLHMAMGNSYDDCFNGNRSGIHWDLVHIQTPEWGGGEIHFDGVLIRKDGLFVHPALLPLNPDELKG
jgi:aminopeptidase